MARGPHHWRWMAAAACALLAAIPAAVLAQAPPLAWQVPLHAGGAIDAQPGGGDLVLGKRAMAVDAAGNVYVTGITSNGTNSDFLTAKWSPAGALLWRRTVNGAANGADIAYALALDANDNVIVTGLSYSGGQSDFLTVKYDSAGNELWRATANGAYGGDDAAYALAVDVAGNVYVTGASYNGATYDLGTDDDYLTIKYSPAGAELWRAVANGAANGADRAHAIHVGTNGITVTGYSDNGVDSDALTVRYNAAGTEQWRRLAAGAAGGPDLAFAIAGDAAGNTVVAGKSFNGTTDDAFLVRYDNAGTETWRATLDGPGGGDDSVVDVGLDAAGNVYAAGFSAQQVGAGASESNPDLLLVKLTPAGMLDWRRVVNGAGNDVDVATALAVDGAGNAVIAGYSINGANTDLIVVRFDPAGGESWRYLHAGGPTAIGGTLQTVALDGGGQPRAAGFRSNGEYNDFVVTALTLAGAASWQAGAGTNERIATVFASGAANGAGQRALAVGPGGEALVTGRAQSGGRADLFVAKVGAGGAVDWKKLINGAGNALDQGLAVAADATGNVFVAGDTYTGGLADYLLVKLAPAGNELWRAAIAGTAGMNNTLRAMTVDGAGDVIVTGLDFAASDMLTVKYSAAGFESWRALANGPGNGSDVPVAVATDANRNVVVLGRSHDGTQVGYLTIKYAPSGAEIWRVTEFSPTNARQPQALAIGAGGQVVVTGDVTASYQANGIASWRVVTGFTAYAVAIDGAGNVIVGGAGGTLVKYDPAGAEVWRRTVATSALQSVAADAAGNIHVAFHDYAQGVGGTSVVRLDAAGSEVWRQPAPAAANGFPSAIAMLADAGGNVTLAANWLAAGDVTAINVFHYRPPVPLPAPPTNLNAVAGNGSATLAFTALPSGSNPAATGYVAQCSPSGSASGSGSPLVVTGLTNGTPYSCTVASQGTAGTGTPSAPVAVTPSATPALGLVGVFSRKSHGGAGSFDVPIDWMQSSTGEVSVEPRGANPGHLIAFRFNVAPASTGTATATAGTPSASLAGNEVLVNVSGAADGQRVTISLTGVGGSLNVAATVGLLTGDVGGTRRVTAADVAMVRARNGGSPGVLGGYRADVDASGSIDATDLVRVRERAGKALP